MRLGNRYHLLSRIAAGGMGEVWRARDELLGREVAVKVLRSDIYGDSSFRARFRNEARITAALTDPGIAQIYDYGEQSDLAYLVMELVHGEPLSAILVRNGSLGADVALDVLHQTAKALHAAHSAGVVHRDIKPSNLLVTAEGRIKVTDFGIARALEAAPVTQAGIVLGTAQYVSPEQAQGLPLTPATDLYSLGIVVYECLAGRTPFQGDSQVAIALQHLNELPPPLGVDVPAPVRRLVTALLAKDPARRPGSAIELADRAYVLRESLVSAERSAELSMLTDPGGFQVRESHHDGPGPAGPPTATYGTRGPGRHGGAPTTAHGGPDSGRHGGPDSDRYDGPDSGWHDGPPTSAYGGPPTVARSDGPVTAHSGGRVAGPPRGGAPRRRGRGARALVAVATVGCLAAVSLAAFTFAQREAPARPPEIAVPSGTATPTAEPRPARTKTRTRRPPSVPAKSARPVPSRSATVTRSATPTRRPTPKPTPSTRTPTPTPTPTPTLTTPTPTPSASPSPGDTNPPKGET
jgi:serine/threonine-protein kinase